jgi:uncharacterized RDD family membrane protein YckC
MTDRAMALRRALAFAVDWLVILLWGGVVFGAVMVATGGSPPRPSGPWQAQALGFLSMTLPVTLYFAICESSAMRASLGKRLLGLMVSKTTGERLPFGAALVRNAVKFIPWECGHIVAQQGAFSGGDAFPAWLWGPAIISFVGPVWWIAALIVTGRTPYDRWTGSHVVSCQGRGPVAGGGGIGSAGSGQYTRDR